MLPQQSVDMVRTVPFSPSLPFCSLLPPLSHQPNLQTYACCPEITPPPLPPWFSPRLRLTTPLPRFRTRFLPASFSYLFAGGQKRYPWSEVDNTKYQLEPHETIGKKYPEHCTHVRMSSKNNDSIPTGTRVVPLVTLVQPHQSTRREL